MRKDELLRIWSSVRLEDCICQTQIQTVKDIEKLKKKSYMPLFTLDEFKAAFPSVPSECVFYSPSYKLLSFYFNKETLAVSPLNLEHAVLQKEGEYVSRMLEAIPEREKEVARGEFKHSANVLPDAMRLDYMCLVVDRFPDTPGLYRLFFDIYRQVTYGFGEISPATMKSVYAIKTDSDRELTRSALSSLPDTIRIYRGGSNSASVAIEAAFSWSLDINVANFFACRFGTDDGYIAIAEVKRDDVMEAFLDSHEAEILALPGTVAVKEIIKIMGLESIKVLVEKATELYTAYKSMVKRMDFLLRSDQHGAGHECRVLLLSLMLGYHLGLSREDLHALATAAVYHDVRRRNDEVDPKHGAAASRYYMDNAVEKDPVVAFLIKYHCLPDEDAYAEIQRKPELKEQADRVRVLFDVFKDADALDRVRFGIQDLDLNKLRRKESRSFTLAARLVLEQLEV